MLRALVPVMLVAAFLFWLVPPAVLALTGRLGALGPAALAATLLSALFWMLISYGMKIPAGTACSIPLGALMALYIGAALDLARRAAGGVAREECTAGTSRPTSGPPPRSASESLPPSTRPCGDPP